MERSYIAFISYKHTPRDAAIAKQVHTLIENYVIPKPLRRMTRSSASCSAMKRNCRFPAI